MPIMPVWSLIVMLYLLGFTLIFIEIVIIPGFGLTGILGIIALIAACYRSFISLSPVIGVLTTLGSIVTLVVLLKIFPNTSVWKKTRLSLYQEKTKGYQTTTPGLENLINKNGLTLTMLRPSGTVLIENNRYDAISDGEFIDKNEKITVYKIEGNKISVKKIIEE